MMLPVVAALLLALAADLPAQFRGLSTDGAGDSLWFASDLRLRGTNQVEHAKLFRASSAGAVELVAQRSAEAIYPLLSEPEISSNASVLSYEAGLSCRAGGVCQEQDAWHGVLAGGPVETEFPGRVAMSRSGRYFLRTGYAYDGPSQQVEIFDRLTGFRTPVPVSASEPLNGKWLVSSTGSALAYAGGLWLLREDGKHIPLPVVNFSSASTEPFFSKTLIATMDDAATLVIYQTTTGTPALMAVRPGDALPRELVVRPEGASNPVLSADGRRLLFLSGGQAWLMEIDSQSSRQLSNVEAGLEEATLSGDGRVVWASTFAGQILRISVDSGEAREIVSRTLSLELGRPEIPLVVARGGLARVTGRGLALTATPGAVPLATEVAGVRVDAAGRAMPVVSVSPVEIVFQVPWDLDSPGAIQLPPTRSPFEDRMSRMLRVVDSAPEFLRSMAGRPLIVHDDFRGLVTAADGARPGEVIHLYLTGLGPVSPAVSTGQPSPVAPLARITGNLLAAWVGSLPTNMPAPEIFFAGLAPGLIGVYQVDVRVPLIAPSPLTISLQVGNALALAQFDVTP